jgi:hypothetical protein
VADGDLSARMNIPAGALMGQLRLNFEDDAIAEMARGIGWRPPEEIEGMNRLAIVGGMMGVGAIFGGRIGALAVGAVTFAAVRHPAGHRAAARLLGVRQVRGELPPGD